MSNKITVEIIPATQLKEGDILLRDGGDTVTVSEILIRGTNHVSFRDEDGGPLPFYASRDVFRVVPEQQEEPVWPDADLIRIIRGTENGNRIDGSLAYRIDGGEGSRGAADGVIAIDADGKAWRTCYPGCWFPLRLDTDAEMTELPEENGPYMLVYIPEGES